MGRDRARWGAAKLIRFRGVCATYHNGISTAWFLILGLHTRAPGQNARLQNQIICPADQRTLRIGFLKLHLRVFMTAFSSHGARCWDAGLCLNFGSCSDRPGRVAPIAPSRSFLIPDPTYYCKHTPRSICIHVMIWQTRFKLLVHSRCWIGFRGTMPP